MPTDGNEKVVLELASVDEAWALLRALISGEDRAFPDELVFSGELESLNIVVEGGNYHATVPGNFARGIWGFQEEIYRATAFALYGSEDLRKLSRADYERFNLVFNVSNGCSHLNAPTTGFLSELAKGLSDMDDTKKLIAIILVAVTLSTGYAAASIGGSYFAAETAQSQASAAAQTEQVRTNGEVEKERERTKQILAMTGMRPIVAKFEEATANGAKQIVKSVPDATEASVGNTQFDRSDILEINARSARESSDTFTLKQEFKIVAFKRPEGSDFARFTLISPSGEIPAILDMSQDGPFSAEQIQQFWSAAQAQTSILLHVETKTSGGSVKQAWISDIPAPIAVLAQSE